MAPVNLVMHFPETKEDQLELSKRVSDVHAAAVIQRIRRLNCPTGQKQDLLKSIIEAAAQKSREQT